MKIGTGFCRLDRIIFSWTSILCFALLAVSGYRADQTENNEEEQKHINGRGV